MPSFTHSSATPAAAVDRQAFHARHRGHGCAGSAFEHEYRIDQVGAGDDVFAHQRARERSRRMRRMRRAGKAALELKSVKDIGSLSKIDVVDAILKYFLGKYR
jgi:hypothetical protein